MAEQQVARRYVEAGKSILAERWRGQRGELDLVVQDGDALIIVEVKKSTTHARAAENLKADQIARIWSTTEEFMATQPNGLNTEIRFDVALLDQFGTIDIREAAICH